MGDDRRALRPLQPRRRREPAARREPRPGRSHRTRRSRSWGWSATAGARLLARVRHQPEPARDRRRTARRRRSPTTRSRCAGRWCSDARRMLVARSRAPCGVLRGVVLERRAGRHGRRRVHAGAGRAVRSRADAARIGERTGRRAALARQQQHLGGARRQSDPARSRPTATAAAIGLQGDVGYWLLVAGRPGVTTPNDPSFSATASFSSGIVLGSYTLVVRAVDAAGHFGLPDHADPRRREPRRSNPPATGALVVTLTWDTESNLDLYVVDPKGTEIYWGNQSSQPPFSFDQVDGGSYGYIDYDSNANCVIDGLRREDAIWPRAPPSGQVHGAGRRGLAVRATDRPLDGARPAPWQPDRRGERRRAGRGHDGDARSAAPGVLALAVHRAVMAPRPEGLALASSAVVSLVTTEARAEPARLRPGARAAAITPEVVVRRSARRPRRHRCHRLRRAGQQGRRARRATPSRSSRTSPASPARPSAPGSSSSGARPRPTRARTSTASRSPRSFTAAPSAPPSTATSCATSRSRPGAYGADYGRALGGMVRVETRTSRRAASTATPAPTRSTAPAMVTAALGDRVRVGVAGALRLARRPRCGPSTRRTSTSTSPFRATATTRPRRRSRSAPRESLDAVFLGSHDDLSEVIPDSDPAHARSETRAPTPALLSPLPARARRRRERRGHALRRPRHHQPRARASGPTPRRSTSRRWRWGLRSSYRVPRRRRRSTLTVGLELDGSNAQVSRDGSLLIPPREGDITVFGQPPGDDMNADAWTAGVIDVAPYVVAGFDLGPAVRHAAPPRRRLPLADEPADAARRADAVDRLRAAPRARSSRASPRASADAAPLARRRGRRLLAAARSGRPQRRLRQSDARPGDRGPRDARRVAPHHPLALARDDRASTSG